MNKVRNKENHMSLTLTPLITYIYIFYPCVAHKSSFFSMNHTPELKVIVQHLNHLNYIVYYMFIM